jgi:hypothetical protein
VANTTYKLLGSVDVAVEQLAVVLDKHLPVDRKIDFLSIDVEGQDYSVIQSNDWERFRPQCVLVEALGISLENVDRNDVFRFMSGKGYELIAKTFNTLVFRNKR